MANELSKKQREELEIESEQRHKNRPEYKRKNSIDLILYVLTVLVIAFGIREFAGEPVQVDGDSMYPNLTSSERVLVNKLPYYTRMPRRGEIVICLYPGYSKYCVKRVIGLPGEEVAVMSGMVFINGEPLNESAYWNDVIYESLPPQTVPENSLFVMGDNRNISKDSRSPSVGPIPMERVIGRGVCVILPFSNMRAIPAVQY